MPPIPLLSNNSHTALIAPLHRHFAAILQTADRYRLQCALQNANLVPIRMARALRHSRQRLDRRNTMLTLVEFNEGNTHVLRLAGRLASDGVAALRPRLANAIRPDGGDVVADLTDVTFIDGAGIGALAFLYRRLAAGGRRLGVAGATGQPRDCLSDLGLARLLAA
jgi:anti-anti-sigma factor